MQVNKVEMNRSFGGYKVVANDVPVGEMKWADASNIRLHADPTLELIQELWPELETAVQDKVDEMMEEAGIKVGIDFSEPSDTDPRTITVFEDGKPLGWIIQDRPNIDKWSPSRVLHSKIEGLPNNVDLGSVQAAIQEWHEEGQ